MSAALAVVGAGVAPAVAQAGSGTVAAGATVTAERALVQRSGADEVLVVSVGVRIGRRGGAARPLVLLPVPATPRTTAVPSRAADLFDELGRATAPRPVAAPAKGGHGPSTPSPAGTGALTGPRITGYDVRSLGPGDERRLDRRLRESPGGVSDRAREILGGYLRDGWSLVVLRLPRGVRTGVVGPLRIRFAGRRLVYPQRLAAAPGNAASLRLYALGHHRLGTPRLAVAHAGPVADLRPAPSASVAALLAGRYVTELVPPDRPPRGSPRDAVLRRYVSDTAYPYAGTGKKADGIGFRTDSPPAGGRHAPSNYSGPPGWLWIAVLASAAVAALLVGGLLRLRRR